MTADEACTRLEQRGVRPTPARILTIRALDDAAALMTSLQIEDTLQTVDRSSISRTLALFVQRGLVHAIDDGTGAVKYELCRAPHPHNHSATECPDFAEHLRRDTDAHPHFHCTRCGNTYCLTGTPIPATPLPSGFTPFSTTLVIHGLCPSCAASSPSDPSNPSNPSNPS